MEEIKKNIEELLLPMNRDERIATINELREALHLLSPFKNEPVDFVKWVKCEDVFANDYNPNKVAPPEMELLEVSIMNDGYTQPIVTWPNEKGVEVIDGFHRSRVGKESKIVQQRIDGYLPTVIIRKEQSGKNDRIASTIRHNRARGKHQIDAMSEIVIELKNRNWTNKRISKQLGMDEEEVLRLCQISGLEHLFSDKDFNRAWESSDYADEYAPITDFLTEEELNSTTIPATSCHERIFHTFDKWECYKAGFYSSSKEGWSQTQCEDEYVRILSDQVVFKKALDRVVLEWKFSCEHYLTNPTMNRIAWLGQAAVCIESGVPCKYCGAWSLLDEETKDAANATALLSLNEWLVSNERDPVSMEVAQSLGRQIELY